MYKISEQQLLNPKVGSVTISCDNNENSKNGKDCLKTNARPSEPTPKGPPANIRMQKPQNGSKFSVQILGAGRGDGYGKIDRSIDFADILNFWMQMKSATSSLHCSTIPLFY